MCDCCRRPASASYCCHCHCNRVFTHTYSGGESQRRSWGRSRPFDPSQCANILCSWLRQSTKSSFADCSLAEGNDSHINSQLSVAGIKGRSFNGPHRYIHPNRCAPRQLLSQLIGFYSLFSIRNGYIINLQMLRCLLHQKPGNANVKATLVAGELSECLVFHHSHLLRVSFSCFSYDFQSSRSVAFYCCHEAVKLAFFAKTKERDENTVQVRKEG